MKLSGGSSVTFAALFLAWLAAFAQVGNQVESLRSTDRDGVVSGILMPYVPGLMGMPSIKGQPYSAEQESEHFQTLTDGTRIHQKRMVARTYRDSEGRTRTERMPFAG